MTSFAEGVTTVDRNYICAVIAKGDVDAFASAHYYFYAQDGVDVVAESGHDYSLPAAVPVPVPSTGVLCALGLLLLVGVARSRR